MTNQLKEYLRDLFCIYYGDVEDCSTTMMETLWFNEFERFLTFAEDNCVNYRNADCIMRKFLIEKHIRPVFIRKPVKVTVKSYEIPNKYIRRRFDK